jgi:hypothetical protein
MLRRIIKKDIDRQFAVNILALSLANALLFHFICIWRYKEVIITEPNPVILYSEIGLVTGGLILAIINLIKLLKSRLPSLSYRNIAKLDLPDEAEEARR